MRIKSNRIGTVGAVVLLAGSLAWAGETKALEQGGPRASGGGSGAPARAADAGKDGVVDLERKYPEVVSPGRTDICGSLAVDEKCRPRLPGLQDEQGSYNRHVGACLPYPILGRLFCWE